MIRSLFLSKKILIIIAVIFLLFVIVFYINNNKNLVVYKKSKGEVTLYINENVYKIDKNIYKININPGYYNYKVTGYVDNKKIVIYDSIDVDSSSSIYINLNIYQKKYIVSKLCENYRTYVDEDICLFNTKNTYVNFYENNTWAIIKSDNSADGLVVMVVNINNGNWNIVLPPRSQYGSNNDGYLPESVEEGL